MKRVLCLALVTTGCAAGTAAPEIEVDRWQASAQLLRDLSDPALKGRRAGTEGSEWARELILSALGDVGVEGREQAFAWGDYDFANVVATIDGDTTDNRPVLVVTAHYDHLGEIGADIFHGADDNASGSAALIAVAESFLAEPPDHDVVLAWVDAEEFGLNGAYHLVNSDAVPIDRPVMNLNVDMISHNPDGRLYLAGGYHNPDAAAVVEALPLPEGTTLTRGYDSPEDGFEDVTYRSDHAPFHEVGLPWVMLTVAPHEHYHMPSDTFENVPLQQYLKNLDVVTAAAQALEDELPRVARMRSGVADDDAAEGN